MANSNGWGDGAANNTIGWGQGANNTIGWGKSHSLSYAGLTDIVGTSTPAPVSDTDAQTFLTNAVITDTTQRNAINTLVIGLKADSLWTKMLAIYPFVGGTPETCKFNLKNPLNTDAAFRLSFQGGWTISNNGVTPNGTTAYANTFLAPSINLSLGSVNGSSFSHYSRTNSVDTGTPYGTKTGAANSQLNLSFGVGMSNIFHNTNAAFTLSPAPLTSATNLIHSRINTTQTIAALNGSAATYTNSEGQLSNHPIYLGARNNNNVSIDLYYSRQLAFAHIGTGLTQAECVLLYNRIQTFQTTLGRQV